LVKFCNYLPVLMLLQGNNSLAVTSSFTDLQAAAEEGSHIAATASTGRPGSTSDPGAAAAAAAATGSAAAAADADDAGATGGNTQTRGNALDTSQLDPRKAKRILANRQSAQRSRMKRLQYINELEGRKDRAEANLRELRAKVDSAQKHHKGLSQEVEGKAAEVRASCSVQTMAFKPFKRSELLAWPAVVRRSELVCFQG
jgi:hypothetical protein